MRLSRPLRWTVQNGIELLVGLTAIVLAVYFVVLISPFLKVFLLDEYRQWTFNADLSHLYSYVRPSHFFDLAGTPEYTTIATSRSLSYWTSVLFGTVCGPIPTCHNNLQLALVLLATTFAVLTVRKLSTSGSSLPLLVTAAVILISVPMLEAITWQATILDKLAMLFTSTAVLIAASMELERLTLRSVLIANASLFIVTVCAYNSKEASFFLAPATMLLLVCRTLACGIPFVRSIGRALLLMAAPSAYVALHIGIVFYNRLILNPGEYTRVTGGDLGTNLESYARYLLDLYGTNDPLSTVIKLVVVLAALIVAVSVMTVRRNRKSIPLPIWALIALLGSLALSLRTSVAASFYLLVPLLYFGLLLGLTADALMTSIPTRVARTAFAIACVLFLAARAEGIRGIVPWFDRLAVLSKNFQETLGKVHSAAATDPPKRIFLIATTDDDRAYMLVGRPGANNALSSFLLDAHATPGERLQLDQSTIYVPTPEQQAAALPGDLRVFLGPVLQLDHIERTPK